MDTVLRKEMKPKVPIIYTQQECIQDDKISSLPITLIDLIRKRKIPGRNLGWKS